MESELADKTTNKEIADSPNRGKLVRGVFFCTAGEGSFGGELLKGRRFIQEWIVVIFVAKVDEF